MHATLSALHLHNLLEYATCKGIDRQVLLRLISIPESDLTAEESRISVSDYVRIWETMLTLSKDHYLGLHYGCFLNLKALGMIYQISLAASSIEQAMGLLNEYLANTFPIVQTHTSLDQHHFSIELRSNLPDGAVSRNILDSVLALMHREIGVMIDGEVTALQLPYGQLDEYRRLCNSPVLASDGHRLLLDYRQLNGPINRRRLKNIETLLPVFLQLLNQSGDAGKPFAEQVRQMTLSLCSPELPQLDQVVAQFATSHRTFQRKLTEEGTSFRTIADDLKRQMASHLARGKTLGTQDIAYILGYSAPSAYLHAVRKWRSQQAD